MKRFLCAVVFLLATTVALGEDFRVAPTGRAYYFIQYLIHGVPASGYNASPFLQSGTSGIGNERAARIWNFGMQLNRRKGDSVEALATSTLEAASRIYGKNSQETEAVSNAWTALNVATITITTPAEGAAWQVGTTKTIRWNYSGSLGSTVKIVLNSAAISFVIANQAPIGTNGLGSYVWTIGSNIEPRNYTLVVSSNASPAVYDDVNMTITPIPPANSINVTSPSAGQALRIGTTQTIRWNYTGSLGAYVKIRLSTPALTFNITNQTPIGSNGIGSYNWTIPANTPMGNWNLDVVSLSTGIGGSVNISITPATGITVTNPTSGQAWQAGTTRTIRWNYAGSLGSNVSIRLSTTALTVNITDQTSIGSNGIGSFVWNIPANTPAGNWNLDVISLSTGISGSVNMSITPP